MTALLTATTLVGCNDLTAPRAAAPKGALAFAPEHGSTGVPLDQELGVEFPTEMDPNAVARDLVLEPALPGSWRLTSSAPGAGSAFTFRGDSLLRPSTRYTITLDSAATDAAGRPLTGRRYAEFMTGPAYVLRNAWGERGGGPAQFAIPYGSEVDQDRGLIYITDCRNHRVQAFRLDGTYVSTWGGFGSGPGELNIPADVKADAAGNVYVVEERNHRVQIFSPEGAHVGFLGSFGAGEGEFDNPLA